MKKKRFLLGHHHANIARHIQGLTPKYSKKRMEQQLRYLLSVNYVQTLPRADKNTLFESRTVWRTPVLHSARQV